MLTSYTSAIDDVLSTAIFFELRLRARIELVLDIFLVSNDGSASGRKAVCIARHSGRRRKEKEERT